MFNEQMNDVRSLREETKPPLSAVKERDPQASSQRAELGSHNPGLNSALPLPCCVTLGEPLHLSEP